jgi:hypothetical protein
MKLQESHWPVVWDHRKKLLSMFRSAGILLHRLQIRISVTYCKQPCCKFEGSAQESPGPVVDWKWNTQTHNQCHLPASFHLPPKDAAVTSTSKTILVCSSCRCELPQLWEVTIKIFSNLVANKKIILSLDSVEIVKYFWHTHLARFLAWDFCRVG